MKPVDIDKVEIVEPPLQELGKTHGGFKRACLTSCLSIIFFIILCIVGIRVFLGAGPKKLKMVPATFPTSIPIYANDNIERITYIPGKYKSRGIKIAAFVPSIILSPMLGQITPTTTAEEPAPEISFLSGLWSLLVAPPADDRDTIQIEWKNIDAEPRFVINYYKTELRKNEFSFSNESMPNATDPFFSFSHPAGIDGSLYIMDGDGTKSTTESAVLIVNLPLSTTTPP